jgi:hypothetical protein
MRQPGVRTVALAMIATVFTACVSDQTVRLRYLPDPIERLAGAQPVTASGSPTAAATKAPRSAPRRRCCTTATARGWPRCSPPPWPDALVESLVAGFTERGVAAVAAPTGVRPARDGVSTLLAVAGEIHNFDETRGPAGLGQRHQWLCDDRETWP